jgi:hypothetical protein
MTPTEMIVNELRNSGVTNAYMIEGAPDTKDEAVSLTPYDSTPVSADQTSIGHDLRIQVYIRGKTYDSAYALSWSAFDYMQTFQMSSRDFMGYRITDFIQSPSYIGRDDKRRYEMVFNVSLRKIGV